MLVRTKVLKILIVAAVEVVSLAQLISQVVYHPVIFLTVDPIASWEHERDVHSAPILELVEVEIDCIIAG